MEFTGGLQAERTSLAWVRTIVAAFVVAAVVGRVYVGTPLAFVGSAPALAIVIVCLFRASALTVQPPQVVARWLTALVAAAVVTTGLMLAAAIALNAAGPYSG